MTQYKVTNIEQQNRVGYDRIANDYTDNNRITTANFHDISVDFFNRVATQFPLQERILEVGSGRGFLTTKTHIASSPTLSIDISLQMLLQSPESRNPINKVCASAFNLPFKNDAFSLLISSLAGSFLIKEFVKEAHRVLRVSGKLIFTNPTKIWANSIRDNLSSDKTAFVTKDGDQVSVYSFTYSDQELSHLLSDCGFRIVEITSILGISLYDYSRPISTALTVAAENLGVQFVDLPILQTVVAEKR